MAVSLSNGTTTATAGDISHSNENQTIGDGNITGDISSLSLHNRRPMPKVHDPARDLSIQVLEKFSLVTRFARETTSQLFREGLNNGIGGYERKSNIPYPQSYSDDDSHDVENSPDEEVSVAPDPLEFDKVSLVWGKPRQQPLGSDEFIQDIISSKRRTSTHPSGLKKLSKILARLSFPSSGILRSSRAPLHEGVAILVGTFLLRFNPCRTRVS